MKLLAVTTPGSLMKTFAPTLRVWSRKSEPMISTFITLLWSTLKFVVEWAMTSFSSTPL